DRRPGNPLHPGRPPAAPSPPGSDRAGVVQPGLRRGHHGPRRRQPAGLAGRLPDRIPNSPGPPGCMHLPGSGRPGPRLFKHPPAPHRRPARGHPALRRQADQPVAVRGEGQALRLRSCLPDGGAGKGPPAGGDSPLRGPRGVSGPAYRLDRPVCPGCHLLPVTGRPAAVPPHTPNGPGDVRAPPAPPEQAPPPAAARPSSGPPPPRAGPLAVVRRVDGSTQPVTDLTRDWEKIL